MCVKLQMRSLCVSNSVSILGPFWVHFGSISGPFWVHFGSILGPFWVHFGSILGPFGVHFGSILGPFWVHFGSILGPFWVASFNQNLNKNRYSDKNQCSDKNSNLDCKKTRERSKRRWASELSSVASANAFGDTHKRIWCTHIMSAWNVFNARNTSPLTKCDVQTLKKLYANVVPSHGTAIFTKPWTMRDEWMDGTGSIHDEIKAVALSDSILSANAETSSLSSVNFSSAWKCCPNQISAMKKRNKVWTFARNPHSVCLSQFHSSCQIFVFGIVSLTIRNVIIATYRPEDVDPKPWRLELLPESWRPWT